MDSLRSLFINKFVHQTNVCKCSSGHNSIIPSARTIGIELSRSQAVNEKEKQGCWFKCSHELVSLKQLWIAPIRAAAPSSLVFLWLFKEEK